MVPIDDPITEDYTLFVHIEEAPIFRGCEGLKKDASKKCFTKKIQQFVISRFNVDLAQELGLRGGKHKMFVQFIINTKGLVSDIEIKAPHKRLKEEVRRVINKLPKFVPGKQQNKPVKVKFTLPITFYVE
ncbi:MAG: energy transducer TonB [Flavobacteriaceae bacterium]|nr:energy transducer TonB [Flavobacteriaceae bacterium]MBL4905074.1 energy transducer TonB [Flavobacteriaceae bacterium]